MIFKGAAQIKRATYQKNLLEEGLEIEEDSVEDIPLKFVKVHCPFEVCTRYAEILKLRMPMKRVIISYFN